MRLKKDHTGWRSSGLWKKYQHPSVDERKRVVNKKKDTKKWCRGKIGLKHDYKLDHPKNTYLGNKKSVKMPICQRCGKQDYQKMLWYNDKTGEYQEQHPWFDK